MNTFTLLIKGTVDDALTQLVERIPEAHVLLSPQDVERVTNDVILYVETDGFNECFIRQWFNEVPPIIEGYGFPAGTLLHFNKVASKPSAAPKKTVLEIAYERD